MKILLRRVLYFLPIVILMVVVNLIADPSHIFSDIYEVKAAKIILSGQNVVGMTDFDERLFQEQIALGEAECPDTIMLGSSRIMELSDEVVSDLGRYRNMGVSGAGLYDYLGILGIFNSKGVLPQKVIIGLDPWILNANNGDIRYKTLQAYIDIFEETIKNSVPPEQALKVSDGITVQSLSAKLQLFSPSYFQNSVKWILENPKAILDAQNVGFYGTLERTVDGQIRYTDGSIEYDLRTRNRSIEEVNNIAREAVSGTVYHMGGFDHVSQDYLNLLIMMVDYLQGQGTEVVFFLPPFHPYVYQFMTTHTEYEIIVEVEQCFRDIAEQRNIITWGSYNPEVLSCGEECFLDEIHMRRSHIQHAWKIVM